MNDGLTRRELLALLPTGALAYWFVGDVQENYFAVTEIGSEARTERIRPIPGGVALSDDDKLRATLGGGVIGPNGEDAVVTNRHVIDGSFCSGDSGELVGKPVYQPYLTDSGDNRIGEVIDAGDTGGVASTDWALIQLDDSSNWTNEILGIGSIGSSTVPVTGERIVMSGLRSGVIGGELVEKSVSRKFNGCHFDDLLRYQVDSGVETDGNSGSIVAHFDSEGAFRPIGIHSFSDDLGLYAIPITHLTEKGITFESSSNTPTAPDTLSRFEGTVIDYDPDSGTATIHLGNVGGETGTRTVETRHTDGNTVDSQELTLDPLQTAQIQLVSPSSVVLETGDTSRLIDL